MAAACSFLGYTHHGFDSPLPSSVELKTALHETAPYAVFRVEQQLETKKDLLAVPTAQVHPSHRTKKMLLYDIQRGQLSKVLQRIDVYRDLSLHLDTHNMCALEHIAVLASKAQVAITSAGAADDTAASPLAAAVGVMYDHVIALCDGSGPSLASYHRGQVYPFVQRITESKSQIRSAWEDLRTCTTSVGRVFLLALFRDLVHTVMVSHSKGIYWKRLPLRSIYALPRSLYTRPEKKDGKDGSSLGPGQPTKVLHKQTKALHKPHLHKESQERNDLYAIGVAIFQLLTGIAPFQDCEAHQICGRPSQLETLSLDMFPKDCPDIACLAFQAMSRHVSASELLEKLERLCQNVPFGQLGALGVSNNKEPGGPGARNANGTLKPVGAPSEGDNKQNNPTRALFDTVFTLALPFEDPTLWHENDTLRFVDRYGASHLPRLSDSTISGDEYQRREKQLATCGYQGLANLAEWIELELEIDKASKAKWDKRRNEYLAANAAVIAAVDVVESGKCHCTIM